MMTSDVVVSVSGTFLRDTDTGAEDRTTSDTEQVEVVCPGQYYLRQGSIYVLYEQREEDFEETTRCLLKIKNGQVSLRKRGLIVTDFEFETGVCHMTQYTTPFGSFVLGITPTKVEISEAEDEISIAIDYRLEENYAGTTACSIRIKIRSTGTTIQEKDF